MIISWSARRSASLLILLVCLESLPIWCQRNQTQYQINSVFKGKIFLLRNFYSGSDLVYDQNGVLRSQAIPGPWTLAGVEITDVEVTSQGVEIVGNRLGILYSGETHSFIKVGKLKIHLARPILNENNEAALDPVFDKIFIKSTKEEDLRPMVPDYWRSYLTGTDSKSRADAWRATFEENTTSALGSTDARTGEVSAPRVTHSPDPKYTKEAASHHIEGLSILGTVIDATGAPVNIAILQPLGMGLDEQAVQALGQWRFRPSMKNGRPVRVQINIEISFKCCP